MVAKALFLGIDLGGTNTKIALVDRDGVVLERSVIPTRAMRSAQEVLDDIAQEALQLRQRFEARGFKVWAAGIGIPGLIDWKTGVGILLPNFPGKWHGVPVKEWLEKRLGLPVAVINDVRAITLAEKRFGAGKTVNSMVMVAIGTGIGGGGHHRRRALHRKRRERRGIRPQHGGAQRRALRVRQPGMS